MHALLAIVMPKCLLAMQSQLNGLFFRLTPAMDFTVISSLQTLITSPRCGRRTGADGNVLYAHVILITHTHASHLLIFLSFCDGIIWMTFYVHYHSSNFTFPLVGFFLLIVQCHTDQFKTLHFPLRDFLSAGVLSRTTIWYCILLLSPHSASEQTFMEFS